MNNTSAGISREIDRIKETPRPLLVLSNKTKIKLLWLSIAGSVSASGWGSGLAYAFLSGGVCAGAIITSLSFGVVFVVLAGIALDGLTYK